MWLLLLSVAALFAGPMLSGMARRNGRIVHGIDGFVLVAMGGLVLLHLLPHSLENGGEWAAVAAVVGLGLPLLVHRMLHGGHGHDHSDGGAREEPEPLLLLALAGLALLVHAMVDGTALVGAELLDQLGATGTGVDLALDHVGLEQVDPNLLGDAHVGHDHAGPGHASHGHARPGLEPAAGSGHNHGATTLPLLAGAVLLHRLPIGIALWWTLAPRYGRGAAIATLMAMSAATAVGFFGGELLAPGLAAMSIFEAFVAGALLHVIFHTHVAEPQDEPCGYAGILGDPQTRAAGVGALLGLLTLVIVDEAHPLGATLSGHLPPSNALMALLMTTAPALVAAFVLAGLVRALLPDASTFKPIVAGEKASLLQALQGTFFGVAMPVRPCSVAPFYDALTRRGVPPGLALGVLAAGPAIGVDAALLSLPLLGVKLTLLRIGAVALVAGLTAWLVSRLIQTRVSDGHQHSHASHDDATHKHDHDHDHDHDHAADMHAAPASDPVHEMTLPADPIPSFARRLVAGLRFGVVDLFDAVGPWVISGLILAAMAEAMLDVDALSHIPPGLDVAALAILGIPLFFCATGGTPLIAVLIHKGLSPGAGIAFLLVAASTSSAGVGALRERHGSTAARWFVGLLTGGAISAGLALNAVLPDLHILASLHDSHGHRAAGDGTLETVAVVLLGLGLVAALLRKGPRGLIDRVVAAHGPAHHHGHSHHGPDDHHDDHDHEHSHDHAGSHHHS